MTGSIWASEFSDAAFAPDDGPAVHWPSHGQGSPLPEWEDEPLDGEGAWTEDTSGINWQEDIEAIDKTVHTIHTSYLPHIACIVTRAAHTHTALARAHTIT